MDLDHPGLAGHPAAEAPEEALEQRLAGLDELARISLLFRSLPSYRAPDTLLAELNRLLAGPAS